MNCNWLVELNGQWQRCGLIAGAKSSLDDSMLCKVHKEHERKAVLGKTKGSR